MSAPVFSTAEPALSMTSPVFSTACPVASFVAAAAAFAASVVVSAASGQGERRATGAGVAVRGWGLGGGEEREKPET
jgi:hypothetical protein